MLKKTIKYVDFNDKPQEETFYFNLTEAEVTEMELSVKGGLAATLEKIVKEEDNELIISMFQGVILKAYGEKSEDGKRFVKNAKIREDFASTAAYSALFMELATDADAATVFINGVIPKNLLPK